MPKRIRRPDTRTPFGREHEEGLLAFIDRRSRPRFEKTLRDVAVGRPKGNATGVARYALNHFSMWDLRLASEPPPSADELEHTLRRRGAPDQCWVISEDPDIDGVELSLHAAVEQIVVDDPDHWSASVISCVPGVLAYYHDVDDESYWILEQPRP